MRGSRGGTHRNKSKQNKARNSSSSGNGNGIEWTALTQSSLWEQILGDISTYFGLTFPPGETFKDSLDGTLSFYGIQKISLLRSFTLKTGVQILLREYQFHRNGATSGKSSGNTFTQEDVLNVFPVVKHIDPKVRVFVRMIFFEGGETTEVHEFLASL